jgi:hypothetical protein
MGAEVDARRQVDVAEHPSRTRDPSPRNPKSRGDVTVTVHCLSFDPASRTCERRQLAFDPPA